MDSHRPPRIGVSILPLGIESTAQGLEAELGGSHEVTARPLARIDQSEAAPAAPEAGAWISVEGHAAPAALPADHPRPAASEAARGEDQGDRDTVGRQPYWDRPLRIAQLLFQGGMTKVDPSQLVRPVLASICTQCEEKECPFFWCPKCPLLSTPGTQDSEILWKIPCFQRYTFPI